MRNGSKLQNHVLLLKKKSNDYVQKLLYWWRINQMLIVLMFGWWEYIWFPLFSWYSSVVSKISTLNIFKLSGKNFTILMNQFVLDWRAVSCVIPGQVSLFLNYICWWEHLIYEGNHQIKLNLVAFTLLPPPVFWNNQCWPDSSFIPFYFL